MHGLDLASTRRGVSLASTTGLADLLHRRDLHAVNYGLPHFCQFDRLRQCIAETRPAQATKIVQSSHVAAAHGRGWQVKDVKRM